MEPSKPSVFRTVVGVVLLAIASLTAFIAAASTEQKSLYISIGVVFAVAASLTLQRYYASKESKSD